MPVPTITPKYDYTYGECICGHPIDATGTTCGSEQYDGVCDATEKLWADAYSIAWVGASNPRGVKHTIDEHVANGVAADHPAIAAMQGHLDFLNRVSLGPSMTVLDAVREHHNRIVRNHRNVKEGT